MIGGPLLAGIDVGTTNTKVGLFDASGAVLAQESRPTATHARRLQDATCSALQQCIETVGRSPDVVGITSMAESGVAVDAGLDPLHEMIRWDDPRGAAEADWLDRDLGAAELWRRSGIHLGTKTPLTRWAWLRRHQDGVLSRMHQWLSAADLIAARLCGRAMTDPTLAGRTGAFDLSDGEWAADVLQVVGLRPEQLPPIRVSDRSLAVAGLAGGTPVVIAGHDHLVAAHAAGARGPGDTADSLGTAEAIVTVTAEPPAPGFAGCGSSWNRTADGRHFCLLTGFPGSGRLYDWFAERFTSGRDDLERLAGAARAPTGIVVEPYLLGRAAPDPDFSRRIRISGLTEEHGLAELALAMLEGACLQVRWIAEEQAAIAGSTVDCLRVFGGPTRSGVWMRTKAAVMPGGIARVAVTDLGAAGAALLGAVRSGILKEAPVLPAQVLRSDLADAYSDFYRKKFLPAVRSGK